MIIDIPLAAVVCVFTVVVCVFMYMLGRTLKAMEEVRPFYRDGLGNLYCPRCDYNRDGNNAKGRG